MGLASRAGDGWRQRWRLRAVMFATLFAGCSDVPGVYGVDVTRDSSGGGFTVVRSEAGGFVANGTHFSGCKAFCAAEVYTSEDSCEGPVNVDQKSGTATFSDGDTMAANVAFQQAILCKVQQSACAGSASLGGN